MSYKINKVELAEQTLITEVEFTFTDGSQKTITIPHFRPSSKEDVIVGIENREISEQADLDLPILLESIKNELI